MARAQKFNERSCTNRPKKNPPAQCIGFIHYTEYFNNQFQLFLSACLCLTDIQIYALEPGKYKK